LERLRVLSKRLGFSTLGLTYARIGCSGTHWICAGYGLGSD